MAARTDAGTSSPAGTTAYRRLLLLYPRDLRERYGPEMVLTYADLRRALGRRVWARLLLDLAVSVPRTRWESVMSSPASTRTAVAVVLAVAVPLSLLVVIAFGPAALPVPIALAGLALAQRSRLARSLATDPAPSPVRSAVTGLVVSGVILAATVASWLYHVRTFASLSELSLLVHGLVGSAALAGLLASTVLVLSRLHGGPGRTA